jgi:hypothetical protein
VRTRTKSLALTLLLVGVAPMTLACQCQDSPLAERYRRAEVIVVAQVVGVAPNVALSFAVLSPFKGLAPARLRVAVNSSDCDYFTSATPVARGERYLLFLTGGERGLYVASRCLGTGRELERSADLAGLEQLRVERASALERAAAAERAAATPAAVPPPAPK